MHFTVTHTYDHPADALLEAMTDFDAVKAKYEAAGHRDVELVSRDEAPDGSITLVTRRVVALDVPGFAKKVLSPAQTVTQTDSWGPRGTDGERRGTFKVEAKGTPVTVGGDLHLAPGGPSGPGGCTNTTEVDISCKVPLIGGRIADFVGKDTRRAVDHEQTWLRAHLAGGGGA